MIKKTVTYTDWDGEQVSENLFFNLNKIELLELNKKYGGAVDKFMKRAVEKQNFVRLGVFYKDFILKAYGVKTEDGRHFEKSPEATKSFEQSVAFITLFDEVMTNPDALETFVDGVLKDIKPAPAATGTSSPLTVVGDQT